MHCVGAGCCQVGLCLAVKCYSACCSLHDSKDFAVDSLSIISSSSWFVEVLSTCTTFGVCFIGGVVVVSVFTIGVFLAVVRDWCRNGLMSVGFGVVFVCCPAVLAHAFFIPVVLPVSVGVLVLKYVSLVSVVGELATFGFIMVAAAAMGASHRSYSFSYSEV